MKQERSTEIKCFSILLVVMMLCSPVVLSFPSDPDITRIRENKTVYVNYNNTGGPWDGTLECPYRTVQDGVANADANDTVFVFHGSYDDYAGIVLINKSLKLIGEDKKTTILERKNPGYIIYIAADYVTVSNFTFYHPNCTTPSRYMEMESNHSVISDNLFYAFVGFYPSTGIQIYNSQYCIITRNTFGNNRGDRKSVV